MGKVVFDIDTKGICLLCLNEHSGLLEGERPLDNRMAFKMLLRYLKINILQLCNFSPSFLQTLDAVENSSVEVEITLCSNCREMTTNFSQLYEEFERIRLQLDKCVQSLYGFMVNGEKKQDRVWEYRKRIQTLSGTDLLAAGLGDSLKKQIMHKCSMKVDASIPKVSLSKLNSANINVQPRVSTEIQSVPITLPSTSFSSEKEGRNQTARRSGPKITARARTAATPSRAITDSLDHNNVSENNCNTTAMIESCSSRMDMRGNVLEANSPDPLVKVEVQMESLEDISHDDVEYNNTYTSEPLTSQYLYPNPSDSIQSIREMDVSSSSVNRSLNFGVGGNADYNARIRTGIFSAVTSQTNQNDKYKCQECGNCFNSVQALHGHMAVHINNSSVSHPLTSSVYRRSKLPSFSLTCKTCGKFFNNTSSLNQHIIQVHSANLPYFKKTDSKIRKYIRCDVCDKSVRTDCLVRHKLIHTGETPFSCKFCNRKFRDSSQQLLHEKSQHTIAVFSKDLPYGTTIADVDGIIDGILAKMKKLSDSDNDRRYECPLCPRKLFEGQRSSSRTHILHKHFDKVQSSIRNQFGHPCPDDEEPILIENIPYKTATQQNDTMQHQQLFDPLSTYLQ